MHNEQTNKVELKFLKLSKFGNELIYPACEISTILVKQVMKKKTISRTEISFLKDMGCYHITIEGDKTEVIE